MLSSGRTKEMYVSAEYHLYILKLHIMFHICFVQVTKFNKILRKIVLHDEDDDSVQRLPELYYVPYDKVCLVYSH